MSVSRMLFNESLKTEGLEAHCMEVLSEAFEIIPKTLCQNCGVDVIRTVTELRAKHSSDGAVWSINGNSGKVVKTTDLKLFESVLVRGQTFKTAIECACMLLRIDDMVSGIKKQKQEKKKMGGGPEETFGDARDG